MLAYRALQFGIFHAPTHYVQQIEVLALDPPAGAHAEIAELGGLVGGVPALHDLVEFVGKLVCRVILEPRRLDHAAAQWRRRLPVLAGKIVFAERAAKLCQHFRRLALGMQRLARLAAKALAPEHGLDPVHLVLLGDRRQAYDVPWAAADDFSEKVRRTLDPA